MYKLHLILKYLRKRRIAWVSLIAVTLCTAMVIVVISVMGGWLRMFKEQFHGLTGEILVHGESLVGFPYYEEMVEKIEKLPEVKAAVPTIKSFGLVNINDAIRRGVEVVGYPIDQIGKVNNFPRSLYRQYQQYVDDGKTAEANEHAAKASFDKRLSADEYRSWTNGADSSNWPGIIVGSGLIGVERDEHGQLVRPGGLEHVWVRLTLLAVDPDRRSFDAQDKGERNFWIVDDSRTKVYQIDSQTVYLDFNELQKLLRMQQQTVTVEGQQQIEPARTRDIEVGVKEGANLQALKLKIIDIVRSVSDAHKTGPQFPVSVMTWLELQGTFIDAVEHEKALVTFLFGMISIVAIFLIFCIFYMIVAEKTKDIGIIKSVGATNAGVAQIFLGYGLAIGIVGSFLGFTVGYLIVHNINSIHAWMVSVLGIQIWNPAVYAFDTIPNTMDPFEVGVIMVVAIFSSVIGALVPAFLAARLHPVEALRWE